MSYYSNPYGCYDDELEEPPSCSECGGYLPHHDDGCSLGPKWPERLRSRVNQWWMRVYYTPVSIASLHGKLKRCFKRRAARVADEDIPF